MGVQLSQDGFVLGRVGQHGDEAVVLGGAADHRRAADIDVLDASSNGAPRATVASNG